VAVAALTALMVPASAASGPGPADSVLLNGAVLVFHGVEVRPGSGHRPAAESGNPLWGRPTPEFQEAVAISRGHIVFVGSTAKARAYIGPGTKVYDLGGRMVMPGIVDGHFHGTRSSDCPMGYQGGTVAQILARLQACLDAPDQAPLKKTNTRFVALSFFGEAVEPPGAMLTRRDLRPGTERRRPQILAERPGDRQRRDRERDSGSFRRGAGPRPGR
jgi:hypothetical protein